MKYRTLCGILLFSITLLNGCLNYTQITTIKTDSSGKMFIHYWTKLRVSSDSVNINDLGLFNKELIENQFSSKFNSIENIEVYEDPSDSTIHAKVDLTFEHFDSLNYSKAFNNAKLSILDGPDDTKIFSQIVPTFITGFGINSQDFVLTYIYYLPGEIIKHNATTISRNKLTWQFTIDEIGSGKLITATYRPFRLKETPVWIYILAGFVIIVVLLFIFRKSK